MRKMYGRRMDFRVKILIDCSGNDTLMLVGLSVLAD